MSRYRKLTLISCATALAFGLAACSGSSPTPPVEPSAQEMCESAGGSYANGTCTTAEQLAAAEAASIAKAIADAKAAADALTAESSSDDVVAAEALAAAARAAIAGAMYASPADTAASLAAIGTVDTTVATAKAAVAQRVAADMATAERVAEQKADLSTAAGMIDTSGTMTAEEIAAANTAIAALKAALAAAVDVSDADKAMYQAQVTTAEGHVTASQSALNHAGQTTVLAGALAALQAIDLGDLSTQVKIDAANAAIDALQSALDAATELSDAEKAAAVTELATADRTVMTAQTRVTIASQTAALSGAVEALDAIDLADLSTQAKIDAAQAAIIALDLALEQATNLTDAEKLDATVDVTVAKRAVARAQETLTANIGNQRTALTEAGAALGGIDLDDLDTAKKIAAANEAIAALRTALEAATHLGDAERATYQTQLDAATETVRTAQTGLDRDGRMTAQRAAITSAVTMARTAVNGVTNDSTDSEVSAADQAIADLEAAIDGAVDLPAGDTDVASAQGTLATLKAQLSTAKTARTTYLANKANEDMKAMTALGKAMYAALAGTGGNTNALANLSSATATLGTAGLTINAAENAGSLTGAIASVTLKAGDSAGSLGGWKGMDYALTTGTGNSKITNEARVYTNQGAPKTQPFSGTGGKYALRSSQTGDDAVQNGYLANADNSGALDVSATPTDRAKVMSPTFNHSGTVQHPVPDRANAVYVRGTYDGAAGEFRCTAACSVTNNGSGAPSAMGGTWWFKPDTGAMVSTPDGHYLYFGWWVSKDKDGNPTAASAFARRFGTEPGNSTDGLDPAWSGSYETTAGSETITGEATYVGHAAGKYAINNVLQGTGHGGHFTADAELQAKFSGTNPGVTGTIDNFRLNDGNEDPGWSVSLNNNNLVSNTVDADGAANWGSNGAIESAENYSATPVDDSLTTVWSINDNAAPASGTWSGTMYDEMPGNPPGGDGSNIPTTVTGTFYSEFSTIGRMVGAFGADKQ